MLTLYYVSATFLQSWRITKVCKKIGEQLEKQSSIAFYALPQSDCDGFDPKVATSELCVNRKSVKVSQILWLHDNHRGCSLQPIQTVQTSPWIGFPEAPGLLPFSFQETSEAIMKHLSLEDQNDKIRLLLETEILPSKQPHRDTFDNEDVVKIENYGKLLAWKIDSHLAVLLETDVEHFTKFLIDTFLQNHFIVNDQLLLLRIESVKTEGTPQPYGMLSTHLRKPYRTAQDIQLKEWPKHVDDLKSLSVLANQATEYEHNKHKTEGKTGVIKPDLIPQKDSKKTPLIDSLPSISESPKKTAAKLDEKSLKSEKIKNTEKFIKAEQLTQSSAASTVVAAGSSSSTSSPSKLKAKPTEIKKPGILDSSRFKTTKVEEEESSAIKAELAAKNASELEKIAAAKAAEALKSKSAAEQSKSAKTVSTTKVPQSEQAQLSNVSETSSQEKPSKETTSNKKPKTTTTTSPPSNITAPIKTNDKIKEITPTPSSISSLPSQATAAIASTSVNKDNAKRPSLKRHKDSLKESKPLNVLVYAETATARESALITLKDILTENTYTIYPLTVQQVEQKHWIDTTALLVVCGSVPLALGEMFVDYFLRGGKVFSLCSDVLHFILPTYRTAEVREHELVQFSYDKWQKVKMMHHIFCYQPSPVKKNFSTDSEDSGHANTKKPALVCPPRSIELKDLQGDMHHLDVNVLGTEETWNTPSLLLANNKKSGGSAVFSQVHLEINPNEFESDEKKYSILKQNETIRHEIFADLLKRHLGLQVRNIEVAKPAIAPSETASAKATAAVPASSSLTTSSAGGKQSFKNAYFLGEYQLKSELLAKLKDSYGNDTIINTPNLSLKFCDPKEKLPSSESNILPILIHSCPEDFSTVDYFGNLKTKYVGRLVIYAPVITSSQHIITDIELTNGIAVIPRQQTNGVGRSNNQWLSPLGCAMFSVQLHIAMDTPLGRRLPLIQHIVGAAMVNALKSHDSYKVLDVAIKWPNDAYANGTNKIGGLVVKTTLIGNKAIVNIGCGMNLDNGKPTICVNDMIREHNTRNQTKLPLIKYETFLVMIFNEIERLIEIVQTGDFQTFYEIYLTSWLHSNQPITICDNDGSKKEAKVIGIDEYGYLKVKVLNGIVEVVQPDGNSFDMLKGLIIPKFN